MSSLTAKNLTAFFDPDTKYHITIKLSMRRHVNAVSPVCRKNEPELPTERFENRPIDAFGQRESSREFFNRVWKPVIDNSPVPIYRDDLRRADFDLYEAIRQALGRKGENFDAIGLVISPTRGQRPELRTMEQAQAHRQMHARKRALTSYYRRKDIKQGIGKDSGNQKALASIATGSIKTLSAQNYAVRSTTYNVKARSSVAGPAND
jgi:hypothetical protein